MSGRLRRSKLVALAGGRRRLPREVRSALALEPGERILVSAPDAHGRWLVGSNRALYVPATSPGVTPDATGGERAAARGPDAAPGTSGPAGASQEGPARDPSEGAGGGPHADFDRLRWERIERAEWDQDAEVLRISEQVPFGKRTPQRVLRFDRSERLLRLIRERVTASVVFSTHVPIREGLGVRVVARRPPGTGEDLTWSVVFDEGLDPADPGVMDAAERALREVRSEVEA